MKQISVVFFAAIFIVSCNQGNPPVPTVNDLLSDNLNGNVVQVTETPYQTDSTGKPGVMDSCCIQVFEYDSAGYITRFTRKDAKGNIKFQQTMEHYSNGLFKELVNFENGKISG